MVSEGQRLSHRASTHRLSIHTDKKTSLLSHNLLTVIVIIVIVIIREVLTTEYSVQGIIC